MGLTYNKKVFVVLLAATYLFVASTHIVCIQKSGNQKNRTSFRYNSMFKKQNDDGLGNTKQFLRKRADKFIPKEYQETHQLIAKYAQVFLVLFNIMPAIPSQIIHTAYITICHSSALPFFYCLRI